MPSLIDDYEAYKDQRNKFEIIAFHDDTAKTFTELDQQIVGIRDKAWAGRDLPFPILMDATGETVKRYGINSYPTMILIDPQGKIVKRTHRFEDLAEHLRPLPPAKQAELSLNRLEAIGFGRGDWANFESIAKIWGLRVRLDKDAFIRAGRPIPTIIGFEFSAAITFHSVLDLALRPLDLTYRVEGGQIVVFPGKIDLPPSIRQEQAAARIRTVLDQRVQLKFDGNLKQLRTRIEELCGETVVLSPDCDGEQLFSISETAPLSKILGDYLSKKGRSSLRASRNVSKCSHGQVPPFRAAGRRFSPDDVDQHGKSGK